MTYTENDLTPWFPPDVKPVHEGGCMRSKTPYLHARVDTLIGTENNGGRRTTRSTFVSIWQPYM